MQFQMHNKCIQWKGMQAGQLLVMTKKQAFKFTVLEGKGTCALLLTASPLSSLHSLQLNKEGHHSYPKDMQ